MWGLGRRCWVELRCPWMEERRAFQSSTGRSRSPRSLPAQHLRGTHRAHLIVQMGGTSAQALASSAIETFQVVITMDADPLVRDPCQQRDRPATRSRRRRRHQLQRIRRAHRSAQPSQHSAPGNHPLRQPPHHKLADEYRAELPTLLAVCTCIGIADDHQYDTSR